MGQGLQIWDGSGNLVLDTAHRLTRILGMFDTGTSDGSVSFPGLATGTGFYVKLTPDLGNAPPVVTISGTTVSWTFNNVSAPYRRAAKVMVGVR